MLAPSSRQILPLLVLCVGMTSTLMVSCGDSREAVFDASGTKGRDEEREKISKEIAQLKAGKNLATPDNVVAYHKAVDALIARGSSIETMLTEALASDPDWGVRVGAIDVLKATGTKQSIEPLLGALEDPEPLVALNANFLLSELTKHKIIPESGAEPRDGLAPLPERPAHNLELDADEKIWAAWHAQYKVTLHKNWRTWWEANKTHVAIQ
jgi:HEAT repeats